jgi:hypothetical protein
LVLHFQGVSFFHPFSFNLCVVLYPPASCCSPDAQWFPGNWRTRRKSILSGCLASPWPGLRTVPEQPLSLCPQCKLTLLPPRRLTLRNFLYQANQCLPYSRGQLQPWPWVGVMADQRPSYYQHWFCFWPQSLSFSYLCWVCVVEQLGMLTTQCWP